MATLTVSTNGMVGDREVHNVEDINHVALYFGTTLGGGSRDRVDSAVLTLTVEQALGIAYDLLYQAADEGAIAGWNVQFPERDDVAT